ncbi:MAG: hypothetical protein WBB39_02110 [Candidatus Saccharimonadales bacterium]
MASFDRKSLSKFYAWLRHIKTWQLVVIFVITLLLAVTLLRLNNLGMVARREAVFAADKKGEQTEIQRTILQLQRYVASHMNTSLDKGIWLEHQYERDREKALIEASNSLNPQAMVYQEASIECRSRWQGGVSSFRNDYVQCVADRVRALGTGSDSLSFLHLPIADNYHYNFISPRWSPDPAGFVTLFSVFIVFVIALRLVSAMVIRFIIKHRFKAF